MNTTKEKRDRVSSHIKNPSKSATKFKKSAKIRQNSKNTSKSDKIQKIRQNPTKFEISVKI